MRTVALEEHFSVPSIASRIDKDVLSRRGYRPRTLPKDAPNPLELLPEIGAKRLKSMDDAGISVQVLSNSGPGPDLVSGQAGVDMARETNDFLAKAIASHPGRFAGFAALPLQSPDAAAVEFSRAVKATGLRRRHGSRHHRRALPRSFQLSARARGGRTARRARLHSPAHPARTGAPGLFLRPAGRTRPRPGNRRLGLALGDRCARAAHGRSPERSTGTRGSSSSSATWAKCCR